MRTGSLIALCVLFLAGLGLIGWDQLTRSVSVVGTSGLVLAAVACGFSLLALLRQRREAFRMAVSHYAERQIRAEAARSV